MKPTAYSYLRFSTPEQSKGDSHRRQFDAAQSYALDHDLRLDESLSLEDLGVSAFKGRNTEVGRLGHFLRLVEEGLVAPGSYLLVESLDRISRQAALDALNTLNEIVSKGVIVVTLMDARSYSSESLRKDSMSLMMALLTFVRANEESETKGRRVRAAWDAKRSRAAQQPMTKRCPSWLRLREDRSGYDVIPDRGDVVRRIYELAASGVGQHSIAALLNVEGVPTFGDHTKRPAARYWQRSYIAKVLTSPAAVGTFIPHGSEEVDGKTIRVPWKPVQGYFPAVVDEETARRAALVTSPGRDTRRGRHARAPIKNILAGLAKCPLCAGAMTRVSKGSGGKAGPPYLVCAAAKSGGGCQYKAVRLSNIEGALTTRADELVLKDTLGDQDPELDTIVAELDALDVQIANLTDAVSRSGASEALLRALGEREEHGRLLRVQRDARLAHRDMTREPLVERRMADLRVALKAMVFDVAAANTALRLCVEAVTVDYRDGQLYVAWRHGGTTDITFGFPA